MRDPLVYDVVPTPSGRAVYVQAALAWLCPWKLSGGVNRAASCALIALCYGRRFAGVLDSFGE